MTSSHVLVACHAWYHDMIGGAFRLATEFAEHLAESGHRVSYVCCATDSTRETNTTEQGVDIYRYVPPAPQANGLKKLWYHIRRTEELCRRVHSECPIDAVSNHSPLQGLGAAQAFSDPRIFINYTVHSPFDDELLSNTGPSGPSVMQRVAGAAARWVDRRNVRLADRMQTDSQYTLDNFRRKFGSMVERKGIVAPGWVESDVFKPAASRSNLRDDLGDDWRTDAPLFFTLRRLESRMGLDNLVEACTILKKEGLRFRMLIGGGGSMKETLQTMIDSGGLSEDVRLIGRLPEEQLAPAYAAADCFVLPTKALECFGLIVLEAFACNTPVIASEAAAIPELAARQGSEWMFEPGHTTQLAERLRAFVTGRLQPSTNLREFALEYSKPDILKRWETLLQPAAENYNLTGAAAVSADDVACLDA